MARHDAEDNRKQSAPRARRAVLPDTPLSTRAARASGSCLPQRGASSAAEVKSSARGQTDDKRVAAESAKTPRAFAVPENVFVPRQRGDTDSAPQNSGERSGASGPAQERPRAGRTAAERISAAFSRRRTEAKPKKQVPLRIRLFRIVFALMIFAIAVGFYRIWVRQTKHEALPPMFMPQPYYYEEEQPVHALLLWREKVVTSPVAGTVQLAAGQKAAAVAANDVVATVLSRGRGTPVRVPSRGYFLPALDGAEDSWEYSKLWLGSGLLPTPPQSRWVQDLAPLDSSRAVGRLIELPQDPRAIFYLNLTDTLKNALERGTLTIRRSSRGPKWSAHVRVFVKYSEQRAKVCLEMPYFPIDMVSSREADFLVCSDEDSGLLVPDSAVTIKNGAYGVFELVGDRLIFRSVTGKPVGDGMFFVSSGLSPGNPVMVNADSAEEKRVRLW